MATFQSLAIKDFSKKEVRSLAKKGISIVDSFYAPDVNGCYLNGEAVYTLMYKGMSMVRSYRAICNMAK